MPGALDGVRIVDLTWGVAGPLAVLQLAEQGADTVKVEPPGGDPFRAHPGYPAWNRSRRSVVLDLKHADGVAAFRDLVATADVLVESFSPGVMDRLGLGYDDLHAEHPDLIYASLTAYPPGHRAEHRKGYDAMVQARSGQQWEQPGWRQGPIFLHLPMPSMGAQFLLQHGIAAALISRELAGSGGQHVHASLYQGALMFTTMFWHYGDNLGAGHHSMLAKSYPPGVHQATIFECADGEWIHAATMNGMEPKATIEELIGLQDAPDFFALMGMSPEERAEHNERIEAAYRQQDRDDLVRRFHEANLGAEAIVPPERMFDHEQLNANGTVVEVDDPDHGRCTQVGPTMTLFATPPAIQGPQPRVGQHTREVLTELGYDAARVDALVGSGAAEQAEEVPAQSVATPRATNPRPSPATAAAPPAGRGGAPPLDGITVLDFGQYLAGPIGPMVLADLGAEVIKVEPVTGDAMRFASAPFVGCQRNKRDIALNVKTDEGRAVAHRLVANADVVHHNMTKGAAARLGLDEATLREVNPGLIYCNTFANGHEGPLSQFGGLDPLYQAAVGLEYEAGAVHTGNSPLYYRFGMCDTANGLASIQAILLALFHRARTGEAQQVTTSLLSASAIFSSDVWLDGDGGVHRRPRLDREQTGTTPTYRLYRTQDGWIQLACVTDDEVRALLEALNLAELAGDERFATADARLEHAGELAAAVGGRLAARTSRQWQYAFDDGGVPAEIPVDTVGGDLVLWDADNVALGLVTEYEQPVAGTMRQFGELIGFSGTPCAPPRPVPVLGQDTRAILTEVGYGPDEIDAMVEAGTVAEPPDEYAFPV